MKHTPHANRPKWAKPLTAQEWKHICNGQLRKSATLHNLTIDASTCTDCQQILARVTTKGK